jgi:hypothetical protein
MQWVAKNMLKQCAPDSRAPTPAKGKSSADYSATKKSSSSSPPLHGGKAMANFPVDPHRFVLEGFHVLEP